MKKKFFVLLSLALLLAMPAAYADLIFNQPGTDPFGAPGTDPFGAPGADPFNQPGSDPFNQPGSDPFNQPGSDPFNQPGSDPVNNQPGGAPNQPGNNNQPPNNNNPTDVSDPPSPPPAPTPQPQPPGPGPQPEPENLAPQITSTPVTQAFVSQLYVYDVQAVDPDNGPQALTFALEEAPSGMTIDPVSGIINWVPGFFDLFNKHEVVVEVTDGQDEAEQEFEIEVDLFVPPPPPPPEDQPAVFTLEDVTIQQGAPDGTVVQQNLEDKCVDDDAGLAFSIISLNQNFDLEFDITNGIDVVLDDLNPGFVGSETVTLSCNGVLESFLLTVEPFNAPIQEEEEDNERLSVHVGRIGYIDTHTAGSQLALSLSFSNNGDRKLEDVKVKASVPELGIRSARTGPFELKQNDKKNELLIIDIPRDAEPGWYMIRVNIDSGSVHRVVHRDFEIVEE